MKTSKIVLFFTLLSLALSPLVRADEPAAPAPNQEHPRAHRMLEHRMKQLDEKLHLTADQKTKIQSIWEQAEQQVQAERGDSTASAEDRKTKRREAMRAAHEQVRAVLTADQQKLFDEMPQRGARHATPATPGDGDGR